MFAYIVGKDISKFIIIWRNYKQIQNYFFLVLVT